MIAWRTSSGCRSSFIFSTLFRFWFSLRNRTLYRTSHKVQTALGFVHARPATRPGILARSHWPGTRFAPYAAVTHAKKGVQRNVVLPHVLLDIFHGPDGERRDLGDPEVLVEGHDRRARPLCRLVPADARNPGTVILQKLPLRLDLADLAAEVRRAAVELRPVAFYLLLDREFRREDLERQRILLHGLLAETNRLLEEEPRIQGKDPRPVREAREHVQQHHPLGIPEGDRERQILPVHLHGPAQDVLRRASLQAFGSTREFFMFQNRIFLPRYGSP